MTISSCQCVILEERIANTGFPKHFETGATFADKLRELVTHVKDKRRPRLLHRGFASGPHLKGLP